MLHIRNIDRGDIIQLMRLDLKGYDTPWDAERWRHLAASQDENAICATLNNDPVAYVAYNLEGTQIKILRLTVHPAQRRYKIGTRLVNWLVQLGNDRRYRRISCLASSEDLGACGFLKACGFRVPVKGGIIEGAFENCGYKVDGYYFMHDLRG